MPGPLHVTDPLPASTPLPYGLLEVASVPSDNGEPYWRNGIQFQAPCVTAATTYNPCVTVTGVGQPPAPAAKADNIDEVLRGATPFTVYAEFDCSPVGLVGSEREALAEQALAASQGWQVERAVWTGTAGGVANVVWPHLAEDTAATYSQGSQSVLLQSPVTTGAATAQEPATGLGLLEGLLADCVKGTGVIHVPQAALPTLWPFIKANGARLKTLGGNDVAVGGGYPGTSPSGAAAPAGQAWIYGTGPVFAYRSPVLSIREPRDALDRANNTLKLLAERSFLVGWGCCQFGVLLDLGSA